jgi:hypothetical protein
MPITSISSSDAARADVRPGQGHPHGRRHSMSVYGSQGAHDVGARDPLDLARRGDARTGRAEEVPPPTLPSVQNRQQLLVERSIVDEHELLELGFSRAPVEWAMTEQRLEVVEILLDDLVTGGVELLEVPSQAVGRDVAILLVVIGSIGGSASDCSAPSGTTAGR